MIPVTAPLGRSERRAAAACYVQGLLMPGQRTVPSVSIAAAGSVARSACLPTAHWKGRNRSMVQHGSGNVSPAQSPLLLSSAGASLASALLLTLSFIPDAPPCRRRQRLRLCPGSQPPNGRSGLLPMNALSDCCTFGLVLASRAVKEKKTASKTPYEAFRTARRPPPLSPHQLRAGRNQRALAICRRG